MDRNASSMLHQSALYWFAGTQTMSAECLSGYPVDRHLFVFQKVLMPYQSNFSIKITFYCYEIISHLSIYDIILHRNWPSSVYLYS